MHRTKLFIGVGILACCLTASCSEPPKPTGPKFAGRVLLLTGDPSAGAALAELTQSGDGYNLATITPGVKEAIASPDQTKLLFATKDEIGLRDLGSGAVTSLVKGESLCLAWAADGNHFSYQQRSGNSTRLFAADLDGKTKLIFDDPNGTTHCAQWIAKDRLVLDRFAGRPASTSGPLKPNTSTVATIGDTVKLKDSPRNGSIEGVCAKSNEGFIRSADEGRLLVARNIDRFETMTSSPAPCTSCRFIGFAAQSCTPFFIEQSGSATTELFYLNPTNYQKQRPTSIGWTFSADAKFLIKSSARLAVAGDTPDKLLLIDTESGEVTPFFQNASARGIVLVSPAPVVWIEK